MQTSKHTNSASIPLVYSAKRFLKSYTFVHILLSLSHSLPGATIYDTRQHWETFLLLSSEVGASRSRFVGLLVTKKFWQIFGIEVSWLYYSKPSCCLLVCKPFTTWSQPQSQLHFQSMLNLLPECLFNWQTIRSSRKVFECNYFIHWSIPWLINWS